MTCEICDGKGYVETFRVIEHHEVNKGLIGTTSVPDDIELCLKCDEGVEFQNAVADEIIRKESSNG